MKITVAICTRNRAVSLKRTLTSLLNLSLPDGLQWEVLVVANACGDATQKTANQFQDRLPLQIVNEPQRGVSHARNKAVCVSSADAILWLDDDVEVDARLLYHYASALQEFPDADFFGGPIHAQFEGKAPAWIPQVLQHLPSTYAQVNYGSKLRTLDIGLAEFPYGANMLTRSRVFADDSISFRTDLSRSGAKLLREGGEETALFLELDARGKKGVWVPDAQVTHWIAPDRQTIRYVENYWTGIGIQEVRLFHTSSRNTLGARLKMMKRFCIYRTARFFRWTNLWLPYLAKTMILRGRRLETTSQQTRNKQ